MNNLYYIIAFLLIVIILIILLKPYFQKPVEIKKEKEVKPILKPKTEPKPENSVRFKFSNDIPVEKSQEASKELLSMYVEPKNEIPTDNPFMCQSKPQKHAIPYSNENIELLKTGLRPRTAL
jgi:hypothetical protein